MVLFYCCANGSSCHILCTLCICENSSKWHQSNSIKFRWNLKFHEPWFLRKSIWIKSLWGNLLVWRIYSDQLPKRTLVLSYLWSPGQTLKLAFSVSIKAEYGNLLLKPYLMTRQAVRLVMLVKSLKIEIYFMFTFSVFRLSPSLLQLFCFFAAAGIQSVWGCITVRSMCCSVYLWILFVSNPAFMRQHSK